MTFEYLLVQVLLILTFRTYLLSADVKGYSKKELFDNSVINLSVSFIFFLVFSIMMFYMLN